MSDSSRLKQGFTLAELLIAITILGIIATFTIPKILTSTSNNKYHAIAKEVASMIGASFQDYETGQPVIATTHAADLISNFNYAKADAASSFATPTDGSSVLSTCATTNPFDKTQTTVACLALHNGAYLEFVPAQTFGGSAATNYIAFNVDPDGPNTGTGGGTFYLYYSGKLTTKANALGSSSTDATNKVSEVSSDPSWITSWN